MPTKKQKKNPSIKIIKITTDSDMKKAFFIREEVFMKEQRVSREDEYDGLDEESFHFLAIYDTVDCGTARWRVSENKIKLERFAVLPKYRNKGVATELIDFVLKDIISNKPDSVSHACLHAQVDVIALYDKFGFSTKGEEFIECDIPHVYMERKL